MVIECKICVGERLRFHPLRCIHNKKSALASCKASRDFITEVDVAWRIDQIQDVITAVPCAVIQPHGFRFDRDAALTLQIHGVKHLRGHLTLGESARQFEQTVGECGLAVIDVSNDGKITNVRQGHIFVLACFVNGYT